MAAAGLGNAQLMCFRSRIFVDFVLSKLREGCIDVIRRTDGGWVDRWSAWLADCKRMQQELNG